jgi:Fe-S-cluster containining protein
MFTLRAFKKRMPQHKARLRRFLSKIEKKAPKDLDRNTARLDTETWKEINCLECANCCKVMTPTYTSKDLKRISKHFKMSVAEFKKKWLYKDKSGDWMNTTTPCQFLQKDNKCSIYAIRPADCSGFPHITKKKVIDYIHIQKQNIEFCPATFKVVEKMEEWWKEKMTTKK